MHTPKAVAFQNQTPLQAKGEQKALEALRGNPGQSRYPGNPRPRHRELLSLPAVLLGLFTFFAAPCVTAAGQPETRTYTIQAQDLGSALKAFAFQSQREIFFAPDLTRGKQTHGVNGTYDDLAALNAILADTGLTYALTESNAILVRDSAKTSPTANLNSAENPSFPSASQKSWWHLAKVDQDEQNKSDNPSTDSTESVEKPVKLEEIVVTAQKRKERLIDVPLSIAAVTSDEIDRRGLVSAEDYLRGIPGVSQVAGFTGGIGSIVIRGIETSPDNQNFSSGTSVATYFGEAPTTNSAGLSGGSNIDIKLVDIERVEVLRGPQGTSFGNSSLGGAVRTIPVAPKLDGPEARVGTNYSITSGSGGENYMIQAVGNLPLIQDKLAVRASVYQFQDSGFYRNVAGSDAGFQAFSATYGAQASATDQDELGSSHFTGGRAAALFQASDALKFTLTYLTQKTELDGLAHAGTGNLLSAGVASLGTYEQAVWQVAPEHVVRGQTEGVFDTDIDLTNAMAEYDLGWGSLLATFSHLESGSTFARPLPDFGIPLSERGRSAHREQSGEIRLVTQLEGAWNFLGGLYAEELKDRGFWDYYWFGSSETNVFETPTSYLGDYLDRRNLKQKAAFAEVSWKFLQSFTLTAGARAYDFERVARVDTTGALFGDSATPVASDASDMNFRGNLSYKPTENALVYASWSQGFRLGKPQPGLPSGLCDVDNDGIVDGTANVTISSTGIVNSDTVDNYELGTKLGLFDNRVAITADIYRIDWAGVPFGITAPPPQEGGCGLSYAANAGAARSEGVELQANVRLTPALHLDLGGSWIDAKLSKDAASLNAVAGDRLPGSAQVNANLGLQYGFDIVGHEASIRVDSIYVGTFYGDLQELPQTKAGGYLKMDVSARMSVKNVDINLFVRNLTDADDFVNRGPLDAGSSYGFRLRPRTIGIALAAHF